MRGEKIKCFPKLQNKVVKIEPGGYNKDRKEGNTGGQYGYTFRESGKTQGNYRKTL